MSAHIKTWQERLEEHNSTNPALKKKMGQLWDAPDAMRSEIAELRAALAGDDPEHGEPFMYKLPGDYDWHVDFAPLPEGAFRIKALAAAPLPQQAAGDAYAAAEFASWQPASLSYRAFCNGCPYCFWECTSQFKQSTLSWDEVGFDQT